MQKSTDVIKVGHKNELNFKIKTLRANLNQEMRNKNEKLCKTTEVMGVELRYLGIYVVLLTRKRTHNDIMYVILCMRKSRCIIASLICGVPFFLPALGHLEAIESNQFLTAWQTSKIPWYAVG